MQKERGRKSGRTWPSQRTNSGWVKSKEAALSLSFSIWWAMKLAPLQIGTFFPSLTHFERTKKKENTKQKKFFFFSSSLRKAWNSSLPSLQEKPLLFSSPPHPSFTAPPLPPPPSSVRGFYEASARFIYLEGEELRRNTLYEYEYCERQKMATLFRPGYSQKNPYRKQLWFGYLRLTIYHTMPYTQYLLNTVHYNT